MLTNEQDFEAMIQSEGSNATYKIYISLKD